MAPYRLRWLVLVAAWGCERGAQPAAPAPSVSAAAVPEVPWTPNAALAECQAALAAAEREQPSLERAGQLQQRCTSLIAVASCRRVLRKAVASPPGRHSREAAQRCADDYCPLFRRASRVAACREQLPPLGNDLGPFFDDLRLAMLEHDFAGAEMQSAVMTLTRIHDYEWRAIKRSRRWEPPLPEVVDSGGRSADKGAQKNDE